VSLRLGTSKLMNKVVNALARNILVHVLSLPHHGTRLHNTLSRDTFTLEVPVVIRLTCDCAVADDAVMLIRADSSS